MSQKLYFRALNCYNQNNYEEALDLLRQCEQSMQVDALIKECTNALKMQYQYVINDAVNSDDWDTVNNCIPKYKNNIGEDDFIRSIVAKRNGKNTEIAEAKMHRGYIIGGCIFAAIIVILFIVKFGMSNSVSDSENSSDAVDTVIAEAIETEYSQEQQISDDVSNQNSPSGKVVIDKNGNVIGRYIKENENAYYLDVQDVGWVQKEPGMHVVLYKACDGQGVCILQGDNPVPVYSKPSTSSDIIAVVQNGQNADDPFPNIYDCMGYVNDFYQIQLEDGQSGYIEKEYIEWDTINSF